MEPLGAPESRPGLFRSWSAVGRLLIVLAGAWTGVGAVVFELVRWL